MNNDPYFVFYANYPIIDNPEIHMTFLRDYHFKNVWGFDHEIKLDNKSLVLDLKEIEEKRYALFIKALKQIVQRKNLRKIIELNDICRVVNQSNPSVRYGLYITDRTKKEIVYSRFESLPPISNEAKGSDVYVLACHSIISFLSVEGNRKRIKQCPHCNLFFIAKDTKRKICYANKCIREDGRIRKQQQRDKDPVRYY